MTKSIHLKRLGRGSLWLLGLLGLSILIQAAWNMVVPEIFGLAALRYPQAVALLVLAGIAAGLLRFAVGAGHGPDGRRQPHSG
jgi:hypothetical protein